MKLDLAPCHYSHYKLELCFDGQNTNFFRTLPVIWLGLWLLICLSQNFSYLYFSYVLA